MIEKWELAHFPFEKDSQRYKARIRGTEEDLQQLIRMLPGACGRPFVTLSQDYNWAFYIYALGEAHREKTIEVFRGFSPNGKLIETPALEVGKELPPMLEDVLEAAAKSLLKPGKNFSAPPAVAASSPAAPAVTTPSRAVPPAVGTISGAALNPNYVFQEFVVGTNNRFTHAAAQAVSENPGKIYNPFFIYGGVGLGKTHLMQAIGQTVIFKNPQTRFLYLSTEKFMSDVIEAIRTGTINQMRSQYRTLDLLLIDDIQFLAGSESTQEEFFHIFNFLHDAGKQIVITSDRPPKLLSTLEDRLRSRFEWGLISDLKVPNLETRVAILKKKASIMQVSLDDEQLLFVAERTKSSIRELEGVLRKIHAYVNLSQEVVNLEFLKNMLGETVLEDKAAAHPSVSEKPAVPKTPHEAISADKPAGKKEGEKEKSAAVEKLASEELARLLGKKSMPAQSVEPHKEGVEKSAPTSQIAGAPAEKKAGKEEKPSAEPKPLGKENEESKSAISPVAHSLAAALGKKAVETDQKDAKKEPVTEAPVAVPKPAAPLEAPKANEEKTPAVSIPVSAEAPKKEGKSPSEVQAVPVAPAAVIPPAAAAIPLQKPFPAPIPPASPEAEEEDLSLKPVNVVCFYPKGRTQEFVTVKQKFRDIIKKHKLKIRLLRLSDNPYEHEEKIDYVFFANVCKTVQCAMAVVLGPPPSQALTEDDFAATLSALLDDEKLSLQFIPWSEITKDYRYLNCALDLSLSVPSSVSGASDGKGGAKK